MKERNKVVESYSNSNNNNIEMDCYYSTSELPCKKHPSSSSVGICAYCLKDRLVKLVCSDCGEQRLSSCSCSDEISSHRNSSSCTVDVGSVGRVSFLIENDQNNKNNIIDQRSEKSTTTETPVNLWGSKAKLHHDEQEEDEVMVLRRSSSSSNCVEIKNNKGGFWRIGKLFRKNNKKEKEYCGRSELWMMDHNHHYHNNNHGVVSRSRSLCSFRGGVIFGGSEDGGSGARSSISAARSSGVNAGLILESGRRSGYSEATEPRRSGFDGGAMMDVDGGFYGGGVNRRVFSLRESDYFKGMDESSFIDLKLDYSSSETRQEFPSNSSSSAAGKIMGNGNGNNMADTLPAFGSTRGGSFMAHDGGGGGSYGEYHGGLNSGGSCRITVNDRGIKRGRKSMKGGWRWIFRYNISSSSRGGSERKRDEDIMFKT